MNDREEIHPALFTFTDFLYAVVFAIVVQQSFDDTISNITITWPEKLSSLLLQVAIFYFLVWDWVLGRILTLRNPYRSYSRFFWEVLIAAFAYGTATAAIKQNLVFLVHFAFVMFFGGLWAWRTERQIKEKRDLQELCMIQTLQLNGSGITFAFYFWWRANVSTKTSLPLIITISTAIWGFILVYEMFVPRHRGVAAGPGFPFIGRSHIRRLSRFLKKSFG